MDVSNSYRFTGYVKNSAWHQERETRLTVTLQNKPQCTFYDLPVSVKVLEYMKITLGPWCSDSDKASFMTRIKNAVSDQFLRKQIMSHISLSSFRGLVKLKCHCDKCTKKFTSVEK